MLELMNGVALELGAERRREVALESMRAARAFENRLRQAAGAALMAVGEQLAGQPVDGDRPAAARSLQTSGDCP